MNLVHYAPLSPGQAVCRSAIANEGNTTVAENVTCPECKNARIVLRVDTPFMSGREIGFSFADFESFIRRIARET